ncbi:hypothetical protein ASPZODRAFT_1010987 [Penicilliopsis zonata CBS 506.65]|uniref:Uncharacterized protein n=1 Tax=Penicilliopsis zonata CBS 506.65 TaxID=1073090 RepID=A0A1L9SR89_9EURO|nr:hypothetical protein ASPZODRAFT_1010987 [Penicilliopsis zonata CBS 506.65]OJJ49725.1 hypothetical protein ASPZODRAFT_1010987 [Penicilliopsis zonata CBS 506.65]
MAHCYEPEKIHASPSLRSVVHFELEDNVSSSVLAGKEDSRWQRMVRHVHRIGCIESSSIEPVPWEDRQRDDGNSALQMLLLWFSMSLAPNNIIAGSLGVLVFRLSGTDAALLAVFGNLLGVLAVGYMSIWGPRSGSRTLVCSSLSFFFSQKGFS